MKSYRNLKISTKLLIGFIMVALLSGVVGIVAIVNTNGIISRGTQLYEENLVPLKPASKIETDFLTVRVKLRDMILSKNTEDRAKLSNEVDTLYKDLKDNVQNYSKGASSPEEIANLKIMQEYIEKYDNDKDQIRGLINSNKIDDAIALMNGDASILTSKLDASITKAFQISIDEAAQRQADNKAEGTRDVIIIVLVILLAIIIAIILEIVISRIIGKPIKELVEASKSIAAGNLNVKLSFNTKDEVGDLGKDFEKIIFSLKNLVKDTDMLVEAAENGKLDIRADASKHYGDYKKIVEGVNNTIDAITAPINESRKVLSKMALNDLSLTMTGTYKGNMKDFAEDINSVHARISAVVKLLIEISVGDISGIQGLITIGKRSENDELMPSMIVMMTTIENLVKEANTIADYAVEGNLKVRSDISKFQGGYREVLEGFNNTLDAIEGPINETLEVLKAMAEGNLTISMDGDYQGSYGIIKESINHTLEAFNEVLGSIADASDQVLSGSNQVSDGSQALSQGTTEQASSIEELTSSITEVAAQTKQNAVNAGQANELALSAKEGATLGNSHMKDMLKSMEEINQSSSNISKIIKVIDDIAFQTNMLALNAAVEAARAGQHGKGFAVVAEEVRNLAARSTSAAKETTELIEGSIKKVEFGTKIANNTAESLNGIVVGVTKAATLVGEIASASNEQATAIYQINKGIEQVSDVVQTNSATAEQSAAASEELSGQASMLKSMVGKFILKRDTTLLNNGIVSEKSTNRLNNKFSSRTEIALTKNKPKISLGNNEFGKY
ncbi:methyl-accepting chemotaxis protein [Clostridium akagii]|uniref:methyl-accepting chemotaxis protein n=1 Tax=Clostridium akagii TaxID=91623 RepID=UPI00047BB7DC|nr:methyl-accepting chemotaxis protein [Clostridium akagii]